MTLLAVVAVLVVLVGGTVEVCTTGYTFGQFIDDLKPIAAVLAGGTALGRGIRLQPHTPARTRARRSTPHR